MRPHLLLVLSLVVPALVHGAKPIVGPSREAVAEVRRGIQQAQVPSTVKARAARALNRLLTITPTARVNEGTVGWSAEGSPFINNRGTTPRGIRSGGVSFRGIAQRANWPGPMWGSKHGVSWHVGRENAAGLITTTYHEVAPTPTPGVFVEKVHTTLDQRIPYGVQMLPGGKVTHFQLDARGKRVAEISDATAHRLLHGN